MGNPAGSFIWCELMTSDPDGATSFYNAVVGWRIRRPTRIAPTAGLPDDWPI